MQYAPVLWVLSAMGLLVALEATVGGPALAVGERPRLAYGLAVAFHVGLLAFGWRFYMWALPMATAYATLLRNERREFTTSGPTVPVHLKSAA